MRSFLTSLLLLLFSLAQAAPTDFIKAIVNGKPFEIKGDNLSVYHAPGGTQLAKYQYYTVSMADIYSSNQRLVLALYLPVGAALKTGPIATPATFEVFSAEPPYAHLHMEDGGSLEYVNWSLDDPAEGEIVITAIKGKVVEGTFRAKLHADEHTEIWEVMNGTFRFTIE